MGSEIIDCLVFEDKSLARSILVGATYLFDNTVLCDVELIIEGNKIEAHKCILAAASLYFRGMFCAGLKETGQREITIYDVDFQAMRDVIKFFYTSTIELTEDNVFEVMNVVELLGVSSLHSACMAFLRRAITVHNCVSVFTVCQLHGYMDIAEEAVRLACREFSRLMELDEFLEMSAEMLEACMTSRMLNVYSENALLTRICSWVKHDMDQRGKDLYRFLNLLNVYSLDLSAVEAPLYQLPNSDLQMQAYKWLDRVKHVRDRGITLSLRNRQRFTKEQQVVLSCGGLTGSAIANVEALVVGDFMWRCLVPTPAAEKAHGFRVVPPLRVPRIFAASAYTYDHVYIIGGRNDSGVLSSVERYWAEGNEWQECPALSEPLEGAAAAISDGCLYVTGGFNTSVGITNKAWVLELGHKTWRALPPMRECRTNHGLLAVNGYIYALAGAGSDGGVLSSVERMNPRNQVWESLLPLQTARSHFAAVAEEDKLYVMGGVNSEKEALRSVQVYDTMTQEWVPDTPLSVARHSFGATVAGGRVYVAAGTDGSHQLATCDMFNPHTHIWHCKSSLVRPRVGQVMATVTLPV